MVPVHRVHIQKKAGAPRRISLLHALQAISTLWEIYLPYHLIHIVAPLKPVARTPYFPFPNLPLLSIRHRPSLSATHDGNSEILAMCSISRGGLSLSQAAYWHDLHRISQNKFLDRVRLS